MLGTGFLWGQQYKAFLSAESIAIDDEIVYYLQITGDYTSIQPRFPAVPGFRRGGIMNREAPNTSEITWMQEYYPLDTGKFEIPSFTVRGGKEEFRTPAFPIKVVSAGGVTSYEEEPLDAFLKLDLNKTSAYVGEQVRLQVNLYIALEDTAKVKTRSLAISGLRERLNIQAFWQEKQDRPVVQKQMVRLDKKSYRVETLHESFLYPLESGIQQFDNVYLEVFRREKSKEQDMFLVLSGKNQRFVPFTMMAAPERIRVRPLPSGEPSKALPVGNFEIHAALSDPEVETGAAVTLDIRIEGNGNLALAGEPRFSQDEKIAWSLPRVTYEVIMADSLAYGKKTYSYTLEPGYAGTYEIGPIHWRYFNPQTSSNRVLEAKDLSLTVKGRDMPGVLSSQDFYQKAWENASKKPPLQVPWLSWVVWTMMGLGVVVVVMKML